MASVPSPPVNLRTDSITATSARMYCDDGANNGATIDQREFGFGTDPVTPTTIQTDTNRAETAEGLTHGTVYYFWVRAHNSVGWGAWSARASFTTKTVPDAPNIPTATVITQTSIKLALVANGNGGLTIDNYEYGYSLTNTAPTSSITSTSTTPTITGLSPATQYYIWARAHNSAGWGAWSPYASVMTIAGARIKVGAVWKDAIPYVRSGGVWKLARPWGKVSGVWKESQ